MTKKIQLSRRTLLASMGAIGAGAALGGAGTMALFNDEEVFEGNQLMAGELDLKVDWQQTYYGPDGLVYVSAFPDTDGDDHQDTLYTREELRADPTLLDLPQDASEADIEDAYRGQFADVPNDLEAPLIDLQDVKPGDHGEVTFSVHLFDNPAYMWMHGDLVANDENDVNEPESHVDDTDDVGELADAIKARLWYDEDGDNVLDGAAKLDVAVALDTSGSMLSEEGKFQSMLDGAIALRDALGSAANVSLVDFRSGALRPST
ncbi:SipW-dependent-type signal peptide-containing protein [Halobacteriaceae archaeon GCM10025711]